MLMFMKGVLELSVKVGLHSLKKRASFLLSGCNGDEATIVKNTRDKHVEASHVEHKFSNEITCTFPVQYHKCC